MVDMTLAYVLWTYRNGELNVSGWAIFFLVILIFAIADRLSK